MSAEEQFINQRAMEWARANKKRIARELTDTELIQPEKHPVSVFMAGSPGAGKTEISKALVSTLGGRALRIDPDEFRVLLPGYTGANSWLFQGAVSVLTGKIIDLAIDQSQSFLLDGTLSNLANAIANVDRSLKKKRDVLIIYVYQEPKQAWEFVQAREKAEGRRIPVDRFIEQLFGARDVVNELKANFGNQIQVDVIHKDIDGRNRRYEANVSNLEHSDLASYTKEHVENLVSS